MKILIADKFQPAYLDKLKSSGHEVTIEPSMQTEDVIGQIAGYEVLIVRSTKVTAEVIDASDELCLIIRAGAGVNTIDIKAAAEKGIFVCNTPGKNAIAVAELAFGMVMSLDRRIPDNVIELRNGQWNKKKYSQADGLFGKTAGIIGVGEIGMAFAERAAGFGLKVQVVRKERKPVIQQRLKNIGAIYCATQQELLANSDIVSLHVPSNDKTKGMVNREFLSHLKDGAMLINTSRGNIIDDDALLEAIEQKNLRVGLDVYNNEPAKATAEFSNALTQHPNVYGTHHIGASTNQAQNAIAAEVVEILDNYVRGTILHAVNMETKPPTTCTMVVRHYDRVGVLASVLTILKKDNINIEHMENTVFAGAQAACATIHASKEPTRETLQEIHNLDDVIQVSIKKH